MDGPDRRDVVGSSVVAFVGGAVFPRLAYRLRWPSRLGGRGLIMHVAFQTVVIFGVRNWLAPRLRRFAEEQTLITDELRAQLRREPTQEELIAGILAARRR